MAYKICLSNKSEIQIDRDELQVVQEAIQSGARLVKVRSGILNPSFIVCIEPDKDRLDGLKKYPELLPDIFARIGKMTSISDVVDLQLNAPEEDKETLRQNRAELVDKFKPDFLKNAE